MRKFWPLWLLLTSGISSVAYAGPGFPVPEPETLALLAIGAAAIAIARWRKKK
jgi:hypothetical protein